MFVTITVLVVEYLLVYVFVLFETGPGVAHADKLCYLPRDDLELLILLPTDPKYWDYRHDSTA